MEKKQHLRLEDTLPGCSMLDHSQHSVRLHAQLNPIKAIVQLCSAIGQLHLSGYTE